MHAILLIVKDVPEYISTLFFNIVIKKASENQFKINKRRLSLLVRKLNIAVNQIL